MQTLHVISHTHWDREWYLTFQQFRLKLVHLIDKLLDILDEDPDFKYFMLDGQTIVLDDYLLIRPEMDFVLRGHIQSGRILIGPWHILPDMFLVSREVHIRNLLAGGRTTRKFGPKMPIGYIPDPFGHPGQVPQILSGFGIQAAADTAIHISVANRGGRFTASVANEYTDTAHRTRHTHAHGGSDTLAN